MKHLSQTIRWALIIAAVTPTLVACGGFSTGLSGRSLSLSQRADLTAASQSSVSDLLSHFWTGDANSGHITTTWNGYTNSGSASSAGAPSSSINSVRSWENGNSNRGGQWDRSTMVNVLYSDYLTNGTAASASRLATDWNFVKSQFSHSELANCNDKNSSVVFASDDAGWEAQALVHIAQVTGDSEAIQDARELIRCTYSVYATGDQQHGIAYNSSINSSGMYEVGLAIAAWDLFALTGETEFKDFAMRSYNWMQTSLVRNDGLYYMGFNTTNNTVQGTDRPDDFSKNSSVSYLAGNMGMAVLNARLYNLTGDDNYRQLAVNTVNGLVNKMLNSNGTFMNDRDAWTNGAHIVPFAREVVTLEGAGSAIRVAIKTTAAAIMSLSRTSDGYYSADWDGATGWADLGHRSSGDGMALAQQLYTSTQAVDFVLAAASVAQINSVIGFVDGTQNSTINGWTCATGLSKSLRVDVYVGAPFGQGGTLIASGLANSASEAAVANACGTSRANYRFSFALTSDILANYAGQPIYVYGIAPNGGSNALLNNSGSFEVPAH